MYTFFLSCTILGGVLLALQLLLGVTGLDHSVDVDHHIGSDGASSGLNLLSIRALSAALAFFGVGGLAGLSTPFGWIAAIPLGLLAGIGASLGVAALMRTFGRFERDSSINIDSAIGSTATVYLTIPGALQGTGKVHATLGGRTCELQAVTDDQTLATGSPVLIVNVVNSDTVSVVAAPV